MPGLRSRTGLGVKVTHKVTVTSRLSEVTGDNPFWAVFLSHLLHVTLLIPIFPRTGQRWFGLQPSVVSLSFSFSLCCMSVSLLHPCSTVRRLRYCYVVVSSGELVCHGGTSSFYARGYCSW